MSKSASQMNSGKAFEYAILSEFQEKLKKITNVRVIENSAFAVAESCFKTFNSQQQGRYLLTASFAVNFLIDIEPKLSNDLDENDILELEILIDRQGELGDVRDVLVIRKLQEWEIGISAKNNHRAVKHSRLSSDIDFGNKWLGVPCSSEYFREVRQIFEPLRTIKEESQSQRKWSDLQNKEEEIYIPVLNAFKKELLRIYDMEPDIIAGCLVEYLVGNKDFYKVIKEDKYVEIQAYNLHGTLNQAFQEIQPKFKTPIIKLPTEIKKIEFKKNSKTTLIVKLNNGWEMSFRIHNASSKIEPSLKFDINLISAPRSLFVNTLSVSEEDL
jgi:hypothetical protein